MVIRIIVLYNRETFSIRQHERNRQLYSFLGRHSQYVLLGPLKPFAQQRTLLRVSNSLQNLLQIGYGQTSTQRRTALIRRKRFVIERLVEAAEENIVVSGDKIRRVFDYRLPKDSLSCCLHSVLTTGSKASRTPEIRRVPRRLLTSDIDDGLSPFDQLPGRKLSRLQIDSMWRILWKLITTRERRRRQSAKALGPAKQCKYCRGFPPGHEGNGSYVWVVKRFEVRAGPVTIQEECVSVEEKKKIALRIQSRVIEFHEVAHPRSTTREPDPRE